MRRRSIRAGLGLALLCLGAASASAQQVAPPGIPADRFPKPLRPVASIVSNQWSSEDTRERVGEAARVMQLLGIRPGMAVADIGAGSGYYTVRLAQRVGPAGRVFAEDIMPDYLAGLQRRVASEKLGNVTLALGESHDPRLPPASVDVALLVHMYHEIDQPFGLLANLLPALRPAGAWRSWTPTARPPSTAPRPRCWNASCAPLDTVRSRFTRWKAARPTSRYSPRRPSSPRRPASCLAGAGPRADGKGDKTWPGWTSMRSGWRPTGGAASLPAPCPACAPGATMRCCSRRRALQPAA